MLSHGVDRTSINPQILDDAVLRGIGRRHTVEEFYRAYEIARASGIRSINTDLIAGLPGATEESFCSTIDNIVALKPENVTVHTYCVKRAADLTAEAAELGDKKGIYSFTGGVTGACVDYAQKALRRGDYLPYYLYRQKNAQGNLENVGFCQKGYEGLYNIFIMEELQSIYACGAGAVTKIVGDKGEKIRRIFAPKYTYEYLK
jgi:oxygen-independent coproporphyrinogen-3 oxidase